MFHCRPAYRCDREGRKLSGEWFGVAMLASRDRILAVTALVVLVLVIWAWIDGGKRELRPMSQDVTVPEQPK
jgi:hypothetical protein